VKRFISTKLSYHTLCLAIGNSRLHWALFQENKLELTWDTQHLSQPVTNLKSIEEIFPDRLKDKNLDRLPLYIASVVPEQTNFLKNNSSTRVLNLKDIPLKGIYPTMGIDRAIALLGAIEVWGYPCLVIDAGTALTFTGAGGDRELIGGAILPGLTLQLKSLQQKTAALPKIQLPKILPSRWAIDTTEAIATGVIHTAIAGIKNFIDDWLQQFPESQIVLTGGDAELIISYLQAQNLEIAQKLNVDRHLMFWGMRFLINLLA
jgi:type III pantothenate kinase